MLQCFQWTMLSLVCSCSSFVNNFSPLLKWLLSEVVKMLQSSLAVVILRCLLFGTLLTPPVVSNFLTWHLMAVMIILKLVARSYTCILAWNWPIARALSSSDNHPALIRNTVPKPMTSSPTNTIHFTVKNIASSFCCCCCSFSCCWCTFIGQPFHRICERQYKCELKFKNLSGPVNVLFQDDAGGPLYLWEEEMRGMMKRESGCWLVKYQSWGIGCAGKTQGVYADPAYYVDYFNYIIGRRVAKLEK